MPVADLNQQRPQVRGDAAGALGAGHVLEVSGAGAVGRGCESQGRVAGDELEAVDASHLGPVATKASFQL